MAFDVECLNVTLSPVHLGSVEVVDGRIGRFRDWVVRTPGEFLHGLRADGWTTSRGQVITADRYERASLFVDATRPDRFPASGARTWTANTTSDAS